MEEIQQDIQQRKPMRVFIVVYPACPDLFEDPDQSVAKVLVHLGAASEDSKVLVIQRWPTRTLIVFDLCHIEYDFKKAHCTENIPVVSVHVQTDEKFTTTKADKGVKEFINSKVAGCHESHGYSAKLPLEEDHRNGNVPNFPDPRTMVQI